MPKPHPADAANAAMIESAVRFEIALFIGTGRYEKAEALTIGEAREAAKRLKAEHPDCSRTPIIYAITADERSAIVKEQEDSMADKQHVYTTKFAATRAAQKSGLKKWEVEQIGPKGFVFHAAGKPAAEKKASPAKKAAPKKDKAASAKTAADKPAGGKRAAAAEAAAQGIVPAEPDFSAPTHARFRKKLAEIIALVEAGDVKGLEAFAINPVSSSPKAMAKYRDLAVIALKASSKKAA